MNTEGNSAPAPDPRDREAADWLAKRLRGFTADEQDKFFHWLAADPRHGEWFATHSRAWKRLDALVQWRPEHSERPNLDLLQTGPKPRRWLRWAGGLAAGLALSLAGAWWSADRFGILAREQSTSLIARDLERHTLTDGSRIDLNRGTALKVDYSRSERRVDLVANEAHFQVTKDARRPFVVVARGVEIVAVGTAFNVRINDDRVEVLVTEGVVRVGKVLHRAPGEASAAGPAPIPAAVGEGFRELVAGQTSIVPTASAGSGLLIHDSTSEEVARLANWRSQLEFDAAPLSEVVAEFNRRNRVQMVIADRRLDNVRIVASFRSEDPEQFVELLGIGLNIRARRENGRIVLFSPGAEAPTGNLSP